MDLLLPFLKYLVRLKVDLSNHKSATLPTVVYKLLFICSQNRARSPIAVAVFSEYEGLEAWRDRPGKRLDDYRNSDYCFRDHSLDIPDGCSLTSSLCNNLLLSFDLIG